MARNLIDIRTYTLFKFPILSIRYDGLNDVYYLFNKFVICKRENDRDFWNDWE